VSDTRFELHVPNFLQDTNEKFCNWMTRETTSRCCYFALVTRHVETHINTTANNIFGLKYDIKFELPVPSFL